MFKSRRLHMEQKDIETAFEEFRKKIQPAIDQVNKKLIEFGEAAKPYVEALQRNMENLRKEFGDIANKGKQ